MVLESTAQGSNTYIVFGIFLALAVLVGIFGLRLYRQWKILEQRYRLSQGGGIQITPYSEFQAIVEEANLKVGGHPPENGIPLSEIEIEGATRHSNPSSPVQMEGRLKRRLSNAPKMEAKED